MVSQCARTTPSFRRRQMLDQRLTNGRPEVFYKEVVLQNLVKFTGKYPWQCLLLDEVAAYRLATSLKIRLKNNYLPVNFCEVYKNTFFVEHLFPWGKSAKEFCFRKVIGFLLTTLQKIELFHKYQSSVLTTNVKQLFSCSSLLVIYFGEFIFYQHGVLWIHFLRRGKVKEPLAKSYYACSKS